MHALPEHTRVPWHRVINAQGRVSLRSGGAGAGLRQRFLLEDEGVYFDTSGRVSLERFGWNGEARRRGKAKSE
jgi:methylated-DNA-protein-cysteine methyltransferase-like protein